MFDGIAGLYASIARETEEHRIKVENNGFFPYVSNLMRTHLLSLFFPKFAMASVTALARESR